MGSDNEPKPPDKVTIPWLLKHVPVKLWAASVTILIIVFITGVKSSQLSLVQEIFGLKLVVDNNVEKKINYTDNNLQKSEITDKNLIDKLSKLPVFIYYTDLKARNATDLKKFIEKTGIHVALRPFKFGSELGVRNDVIYYGNPDQLEIALQLLDKLKAEFNFDEVMLLSKNPKLFGSLGLSFRNRRHVIVFTIN